MTSTPADLTPGHRDAIIQRLAAVVAQLSDVPAEQVQTGAELGSIVAALADATGCFVDHPLIDGAPQTASVPQRSGDLLLAAQLLLGALQRPAPSD